MEQSSYTLLPAVMLLLWKGVSYAESIAWLYLHFSPRLTHGCHIEIPVETMLDRDMHGSRPSSVGFLPKGLAFQGNDFVFRTSMIFKKASNPYNYQREKIRVLCGILINVKLNLGCEKHFFI